MTKFCIFSDLHSNFEALEIIFSMTKNSGIESYVHCGDILGYGCQYIEVIEAFIKTENILNVRGNHDIISMEMTDSFISKYEKMTVEHINYLRNLPEFISANGFDVTHEIEMKENLAGPDFTFAIKAAVHAFFDKNKIIFTGHTHKFTIYESEIKTQSFKSINPYGSVLKIDSSKLYIFVVPPAFSVDENNSNFSIVEYIIFDTDLMTIEKFSYPFENGIYLAYRNQLDEELRRFIAE